MAHAETVQPSNLAAPTARYLLLLGIFVIAPARADLIGIYVSKTDGAAIGLLSQSSWPACVAAGYQDAAYVLPSGETTPMCWHALGLNMVRVCAIANDQIQTGRNCLRVTRSLFKAPEAK